VTNDQRPNRRPRCGRARFIFGPRETGGVILGLRAAQLGALVAGLSLLVAGLSRGRTGAVAGLVMLAGAAAFAFVGVGGRSADQWAPVLAAHALQRLRGQHVFRGGPAAADRAAVRRGPALDLPGVLANLTLLAVPVEGGRAVGVVKDPQRHTYSAVVAVRGATFALLEAGERTRRVAAWGALLAGLAREGSPVCRLQWVERTVPDTGNALQRYWQEAGRHDDGDRPLSAAAASYAELIAAAAPVTQSHETYLALAIDARRARRAVGQAGGGDRGGCGVLLRELAAMQEQLARAQLDVVGWLPPRGLAAVLRTAFEPGNQRTIERRDSVADAESGVDPGVAGPVAAEAAWGHYRTDDGWHATYWVHEWPRMEVGADFLAPLLLQTTCRRTVALVAEPVSPRKAARQVTTASTSELTNQSMRDRVGQVTTERQRTEAADVRRRERELVAGHGQYRFIAYITVTGTTSDELEEACGQVEQAAHQSLLEIRRLHGEQDQAFAFSLPLCRGL
jgi:hypothetical protein